MIHWRRYSYGNLARGIRFLAPLRCARNDIRLGGTREDKKESPDFLFDSYFAIKSLNDVTVIVLSGLYCIINIF